MEGRFMDGCFVEGRFVKGCFVVVLYIRINEVLVRTPDCCFTNF